MPRVYFTFDSENGYPGGTDIFYECVKCGDVIPSTPASSAHCACRNVMIDADYGRISIGDQVYVKAFSVRS